MSLTLYFHPLASYCQKVLIALYENATPFAPRLDDLGNSGPAYQISCPDDTALSVTEGQRKQVAIAVGREDPRCGRLNDFLPRGSLILTMLAVAIWGIRNVSAQVPGKDVARGFTVRSRYFENQIPQPTGAQEGRIDCIPPIRGGDHKDVPP